ncbi:hypothetical protein PVAND_012675 [Polypedilum vanderplanki]|uniref:DUF229 domain containing protein n=1 Tax=Polypedilum vanderplanki TaxID=319348 RepID=A0A9J6CP54_POLVA|nr:hypothetical protein PVAND_012675 [Polypedilum vanderplanki]
MYYSSVPGEFLIDNENCKIPNVNPYSSNAMNIFKVRKAKNCSDLPLLTSIERISYNDVRLNINYQYSKDYLSFWQNKFYCYYQRISRSQNEENADDEILLSGEFIEFNSNHQLKEEDEFIFVTCDGFYDFTLIRYLKTSIYKNVHAVIVAKKSVSKKLTTSNNKDKTNVLFIGIDSLSRLNLIRAMPATHDYLQQNQWIEMKGYNKIGDNTFPNLMAVLTGVNESHAFKICNPYEVGAIHNCKFLWDDFNEGNYATAYAEDFMTFSSFNYLKKGFLKPPTDYYMRPPLLAAEKLLNIKRDFSTWSITCVGLQHYADYIYNYAADFVETFKNSSYFGLFWTNSFSHEDLSLPSSYDIKMRKHLRKLEEMKILENTIIILFADHGMRFGPIRKYFTGWLEERLPFLYLWFPQKFQNEHPKLIENLKINSDRLTTPYDLYITAKHILMLSGDYNKSLELTAQSCPNCQSLFNEIPINRTCSEVSIPNEYCTCTPFKEIDNSLPVVFKIANFIVDQLNEKLSKYDECAKLKLNKIISARNVTFNDKTETLVSFSVLPSNGEFEATVRSSISYKNFKLLGEISRINRYGDQSKCVHDSHLRKFCYCL